MQQKTTYGAELEKAIADTSNGRPHRVSQQFFERLKDVAQNRQTFLSFHESDSRENTHIGVVSTDLGEQGLDNGFNLLETALPPVTSLTALKKKMEQDLISTAQELRKEGASIINLSIHPLGKRDFKTYCRTVVPKRFYSSLWYRGWDHTAGIDARAQNSPTTSVTVENAADAVSVIIGAGAAFIALFGNSSYEEGKRSQYKESRLSMWPRMMKNSKVSGDRKTIHFPPKRFRTLAQYFTWMHGGDTGIFFVLNSQSYKHAGKSIVSVFGNPSILEYLSKPSWQAFETADLMSNFPPQPITVIPNISHMEVLQFQQFTGARMRYKLKNYEQFDLSAFLEACKKTGKKDVEEIFKKFTEYVYIEGRDPGANFPDIELFSYGEDIAKSTYISPSVLQAGLLRNIEKATEYIDGFPWKKLGALRDAAIKDGLAGSVDDLSVYDFTKKIFDLATSKLSSEEQKMLVYPEYVLKIKQNGADRAIAFVNKQQGNMEKKLKALVKSRSVKIDL